MTMIISAHLGDCILIAADKRSMLCDLETGSLRLYSDQEQKIKLWSQGAIASAGEATFLNRIEQYFMHHQHGQLKQIDTIYEELERRVLEGVPITHLIHNTIIYSFFNGQDTKLYSIPTTPFFQVFKQNGRDIIRPQLNEILPNDVNVQCFNLPPDMSSLQNFQKNIKPLRDFDHDLDYLEYYIMHLKEVFAQQASIDPSITRCFDLYIQSCKTGKGVKLHVPDSVLDAPMAQNLNNWDTLKENGPLSQSTSRDSSSSTK